MDVQSKSNYRCGFRFLRDFRDVDLSVALNYHIIPDKANVVYQTIQGLEFKGRIIDPRFREVMEAVTARYYS